MASGEKVCVLLLLSAAGLSGVAESLRIARPVTCKGQDGQLHQLGETYTYGCMSCQCTEKGEMCAIPMCAAIACDNYITKGPGCCPVCSEEPMTCKGQDGQLHKVGESYEYGCMHCHCTENGELCAIPMCVAVVCENPSSAGPGCCPTCPDDTFTCKGQDGQLHKAGEKYEYGCMTCECSEKGELCYSPRCAPATCEDFVSDGPGCCPTCPEDSCTCKGQDGQLHKVGEKYKYGCMPCECTESGEQCYPLPCAPPNCADPVSEGPGCCPICPDGPVTCEGQDGQLHQIGEQYEYGCMPCECTESGEQCYPLPCAPPPCADPISEGPGCCPICPDGGDCTDPYTGMTIPRGQSMENHLGMTCSCLESSGGAEAMCYYVDEFSTTTVPDTTTTTEFTTTTFETTTTPPAGCYVEGHYYEPGESFSMTDPCAYYCECQGYGQGYQCYPAPCTVAPCPNPVPNGYCCATCPNGPACHGLNGDEIPEGETKTYPDGSQCYCHISYDSYLTGFMCTPVTTSQPDTTPPMITTPPPGCYVEGHYYEPGETFSMTQPCEQACVCQGFGQGYECNPLPCTVPPCPNPVSDGYCCGTCPDGPACSGLQGDVIPVGQTKTYPDGSQCFCDINGDYHNGFMCTPVTTSQPDTTPPMITTPPPGCYVEGHYYEPGETFSMSQPCEQACVCQGFGQGYECNPLPCTVPPCPNPISDGYCCGTCPDGPACSGLQGDVIPVGQTKTYPDGSQCFCDIYGDYHNGFMCTPVTTPPMSPATVP